MRSPTLPVSLWELTDVRLGMPVQRYDEKFFLQENGGL
jgi:hypothetical protein